jgi:hypothetical protein
MEKLSLDDRPPMGLPPPQQLPGVLGMAPPAAPQLPPQMFTTAAQLLNLTDSERLDDAWQRTLLTIRREVTGNSTRRSQVHGRIAQLGPVR